jgi:hypothetical protein
MDSASLMILQITRNLQRSSDQRKLRQRVGAQLNVNQRLYLGKIKSDRLKRCCLNQELKRNGFAQFTLKREREKNCRGSILNCERCLKSEMKIKGNSLLRSLMLKTFSYQGESKKLETYLSCKQQAALCGSGSDTCCTIFRIFLILFFVQRKIENTYVRHTHYRC